jgi:hypothetical protein
VRLFARLLAALPILFAGIRFAQTGSDARYFGMAAASLAGTALLFLRPGSLARPTPGRLLLALVLAGGLAATIGVLLGATAGVGVAVVALGFGLCTTLGIGLLSARSTR